MPRYYFHVQNSNLLPDPEGTTFHSDWEARLSAIKSARELLAEGVHVGVERTGWIFHVVDEFGREAFQLPFSETLRKE